MHHDVRPWIPNVVRCETAIRQQWEVKRKCVARSRNDVIVRPSPTELVSDRQLPTRLRRTKVVGSISVFKGTCRRRIADGELVWGRERGGKCPKGEPATMDRQIDRLIR